MNIKNKMTKDEQIDYVENIIFAICGPDLESVNYIDFGNRKEYLKIVTDFDPSTKITNDNDLQGFAITIQKNDKIVIFFREEIVSGFIKSVVWNENLLEISELLPLKVVLHELGHAVYFKKIKCILSENEVSSFFSFKKIFNSYKNNIRSEYYAEFYMTQKMLQIKPDYQPSNPFGIINIEVENEKLKNKYALDHDLNSLAREIVGLVYKYKVYPLSLNLGAISAFNQNLKICNMKIDYSDEMIADIEKWGFCEKKLIEFWINEISKLGYKIVFGTIGDALYLN